MRIQTDPEHFINSITAWTAIVGMSLLLLRQFRLASLVFAALSLGSAGVVWDRYSTKSGSSMDIRVFKKRRVPDESEMEFIVGHLPYLFLAAASYYAEQKLKKN
ncbi:MAG TPA: hypothetical protein VLE47_01635 [Candidatus Saccharimonadales bacterium]|nr:hypothetical protein [Candidatus Saccharimonadales bacterium]